MVIHPTVLQEFLFFRERKVDLSTLRQNGVQGQVISPAAVVPALCHVQADRCPQPANLGFERVAVQELDVAVYR